MAEDKVEVYEVEKNKRQQIIHDLKIYWQQFLKIVKLKREKKKDEKIKKKFDMETYK